LAGTERAVFGDLPTDARRAFEDREREDESGSLLVILGGRVAPVGAQQVVPFRDSDTPGFCLADTIIEAESSKRDKSTLLSGVERYDTLGTFCRLAGRSLRYDLQAGVLRGSEFSSHSERLPQLLGECSSGDL
jgi:hypothetical protein